MNSIPLFSNLKQEAHAPSTQQKELGIVELDESETLLVPIDVDGGTSGLKDTRLSMLSAFPSIMSFDTVETTDNESQSASFSTGFQL